MAARRRGEREGGREREERDEARERRKRVGGVCVCVCVYAYHYARARASVHARVVYASAAEPCGASISFSFSFFLFSFLFRTRHLASSSIFFPPFSLGSTSTLSTFRFRGTGKEGEREGKKFGCEAKKKRTTKRESVKVPKSSVKALEFAVEEKGRRR